MKMIGLKDIELQVLDSRGLVLFYGSIHKQDNGSYICKDECINTGTAHSARVICETEYGFQLLKNLTVGTYGCDINFNSLCFSSTGCTLTILFNSIRPIEMTKLLEP